MFAPSNSFTSTANCRAKFNYLSEIAFPFNLSKTETYLSNFRWECWRDLFILLTQQMCERKNIEQFRKTGGALPSTPDISDHSWHFRGHTWRWWLSHAWAARTDSLGNTRQSVICPERSGQDCWWPLPFFSRSVTSAFPSQREGGSGSIVSGSEHLVPSYSYESKNFISAGGEGAWQINYWF